MIFLEKDEDPKLLMRCTQKAMGTDACVELPRTLLLSTFHILRRLKETEADSVISFT